MHGPDAAAFLDYLYANTFSSLPVGRARYGIMLREDGMVLDDGTTSRLGAGHFVVTTTTANATAVLEHMEFQLQSQWLNSMDVLVSDVTDEWRTVRGRRPVRAREVLAAAVTGVDLSNAAFPFMAAAAMELAGIPGPALPDLILRRARLRGRAVPARDARPAWLALLAAGAPCGLRPYGLDALNTLLIEKGHITGAELNGNTTAADLGFGRMLKKTGDFVGRTLAQRAGHAGRRAPAAGWHPRRWTAASACATACSWSSRGPRARAWATSPPARRRPMIQGGWGLRWWAAARHASAAPSWPPPRSTMRSWRSTIVSPHMLDPENARVRA